MKNVSSARKRVLSALTSGWWIPGYMLTAPEIGGSEGLRRLRELRRQGYKIEKRAIEGSNAYEYRLLGPPT